LERSAENGKRVRRVPQQKPLKRWGGQPQKRPQHSSGACARADAGRRNGQRKLQKRVPQVTLGEVSRKWKKGEEGAPTETPYKVGGAASETPPALIVVHMRS
jgi:hypothetical protein